MAEIKGKDFGSPDEVREFKDGKGKVELVDLNGPVYAARQGHGAVRHVLPSLGIFRS